MDDLRFHLETLSLNHLTTCQNTYNTLEIDIDELSGGEKQKVTLVKSYLKESKLLILDENSSALDLSGIDGLKKLSR